MRYQQKFINLFNKEDTMKLLCTYMMGQAVFPNNDYASIFLMLLKHYLELDLNLLCADDYSINTVAQNFKGNVSAFALDNYLILNKDDLTGENIISIAGTVAHEYMHFKQYEVRLLHYFKKLQSSKTFVNLAEKYKDNLPDMMNDKDFDVLLNAINVNYSFNLKGDKYYENIIKNYLQKGMPEFTFKEWVLARKLVSQYKDKCFKEAEGISVSYGHDVKFTEKNADDYKYKILGRLIIAKYNHLQDTNDENKSKAVFINLKRQIKSVCNKEYLTGCVLGMLTSKLMHHEARKMYPLEYFIYKKMNAYETVIKKKTTSIPDNLQIHNIEN